jgi:hypothetical protein
MGITSSISKPDEAIASQKQVKVLVDAEIANAFKAACIDAGVSMAGELAEFMSGYSKVAKKPRLPTGDISTRRKRRKKIGAIISQIERIKEAEMRYHDNFPENLRTSAPFKSAEESIFAMGEIIELLGSVYEQ